ncbi:hypothetical protein G6514_003038 [Epicoccum nigrum]|nr:hypothetical protein G6514_003038 [Epicoccum nigrum]
MRGDWSEWSESVRVQRVELIAGPIKRGASKSEPCDCKPKPSPSASHAIGNLMSATATLRPAAHTKSLHLLRALLREASYLPDVTARDYFRRYIVARFKAYQPKANATASFDVKAVDKFRHRSFKRRHEGIINERAGQQQRKAQKSLNLLRRATQGEGRIVQKLLWVAYGRLGRRKYALLEGLLKPDPAWPAGPTPLQQLYHSDLRCLQYFDAPTRSKDNTAWHLAISRQYPRLREVVRTQVHKGIALRREMKKPFLATPIVNTWLQPMPLKRAVNNVRRWYAETMTRLLPPLPAAEWDRVDALSKGRQRIDFVKRRTPVAASAPPSHDVAMAEETSLEQLVQRSLAMDKPTKVEKARSIGKSHLLTARYMQRMYLRLLSLSCKLEYNDTKKRWDVIWGDSSKGAKPASYTEPVDDVLFVGVNAKNGLVVRTCEKAEKVPPSRTPLPRNDDGHVQRFPFFAEQLPASHPMRRDLDVFKRQRETDRARAGALDGRLR